MTVRPYLVNGEWRTGTETFEVRSPYDDGVVAEIRAYEERLEDFFLEVTRTE